MSVVQDSLGKIVGGAVVVFLGTLIGRGLSLLGQVLIVRFLSPTVFGQIALAYTTSLVVARLGLLGVPPAIPRLLSDDGVDPGDSAVLGSGVLVSLVSGATLALIVYLFRGNVASVMREPALSGLLASFSPFLLMMPVAMVSVAALRARKLSLRAVLARDIGPRSIGLCLFGVLVAVNRPLDGAVLFWVIGPVVTLLVATPLLAKVYRLRSIGRGFRPTTLRTLLSFSWPLAISVSVLVLMSTADVLLIGLFLTSEQVGFYRSVSPFRQVTQVVLQSFGFLFLPLATEYYSRGAIEDLGELYRIVSKWVALGTLPAVLLLSLFPGEVIRTVLGPSYLPAAGVLSVLTAGLFLSAIVGPDGEMTMAINRPRVEMYTAVLGLVVNVILNVVLIPRIGILGAAIATVIGYAVFNLMEVAIVYREVGAHPFSRTSVLPVAVTTVLAVGLRQAAGVVGPTRFEIPSLVAITVVIVVVELAVVVGSGSVDEADVRLFRRLKNRIED